MPLIKVLHILPDLMPGGIQFSVVDMASYLDRDRFQPMVCCLRAGGALARKLQEQRVPVHTCYVGGQFSPSGLWRLRTLIAELGVHVVHTHLPHANCAGRLAAVWAGVPVVFCHHYHAAIPSQGQRSWVRRWLGRRTEVIFCASSEVRERRLGTGDETAEQLTVFYPFVEPSDFQDNTEPSVIKAEFGFPANLPVVGMVGSLKPEKNHALFLATAKKLFDEDPAIHFAIIGAGELRQALAARVLERGLSQCVTFTGQQHDMARTYRALNAVVLCSETGNSGKVILEAQAAEVPVVAMDASGVREVMAGGGGYLVDEATPQAFALAIDHALQPENRFALVQQARKNVAHFSAARRVTMLEDVYSEWVEKKHAFQHIY